MIIDELERANQEAIRKKDHSARAILSVLISRYRLLSIEAKAQKKACTDADMVRLIGKLVKELAEEKEGYAKVGNQEAVEDIVRQDAVIRKYLPQMMSEEEIRKEILSLKDASLPAVMKHFATHFAGRCDMGLVNKIFKSMS